MRRGAGLIGLGLVAAGSSDGRMMDLLGRTPLGRHDWFWHGFAPTVAIAGLMLIATGIALGHSPRHDG